MRRYNLFYNAQRSVSLFPTNNTVIKYSMTVDDYITRNQNQELLLDGQLSIYKPVTRLRSNTFAPLPDSRDHPRCPCHPLDGW